MWLSGWQRAPPDFSFCILDGELTRCDFGRKGAQRAGSLTVFSRFVGDDGACDETFDVLPDDRENQSLPKAYPSSICVI
ncbi:hypothetical protein, partial [Paraburkholderia sediminicola]|uniref:hypothetical protein n=1 Tax=Paraburkholderia sediminicola TaxID=458836 RepID=UPI0038BA02CF